MKKHFLAAAFAIIMCLTALAGCSLVRGFEKDVYVVFNIDGEYYDSCTVNIFNNGVIAQPEEPKGSRAGLSRRSGRKRKYPRLNFWKTRELSVTTMSRTLWKKVANA